MKIHIRINDENIGPIDLKDIANYAITKETPVWTEGLTKWTTAGEFEPLNNYFKITPPEFEFQPPKPERPTSTNPIKSGHNRILLSIVAVVIIGFIAIIIVNQRTPDPNYQSYDNSKDEIADEVTANNNNDEPVIPSNETTPEFIDPITARNIEIRNNWKDYIKISRSAYNYSELGGISNLAIIISNTTPYTINGVGVRVKILTVNGYNHKTEFLYFEDIKPNSQQQQYVPPTTRGVKVEYEIASAWSKGLKFSWDESDHVGNGSLDDPWKHNY